MTMTMTRFSVLLIAISAVLFAACAPQGATPAKPAAPTTPEKAGAETPAADPPAAEPPTAEPAKPAAAPAKAPQKPAPLSTKGLVAYWKMDTAGEVQDQTGNGHDLEIRNGADGVDVALAEGGGLQFSGDDLAITQKGAIASRVGSKSNTVACWFRTDTFENSKFLCGWYRTKPERFIQELRLNGADSAQFVITDFSQKDTESKGVCVVRGGKGLNDGEWHLLVGVRKFGQALELYVDGKLAKTVPDPGWALPKGTPFALAGLRPYTGVIGGVSVWARPLTARDINALHAAGPLGFPAAG